MCSKNVNVDDEVSNNMSTYAITSMNTAHLQTLLTQDVYSYFILIKLLSPVSLFSKDNSNTCVYDGGVGYSNDDKNDNNYKEK